VVKIIVIYARFLPDVACQKLLKSANVSRNCSKNKSGFLFLEHGVDEKGIKYSWKEYVEKLTKEENERDHRILAGDKQGGTSVGRDDNGCVTLM